MCVKTVHITYASRGPVPELWAEYESQTATLAAQLCEQLRLILEPTLTDRLEGDFKTGKRINMKKVDPKPRCWK